MSRAIPCAFARSRVWRACCACCSNKVPQLLAPRGAIHVVFALAVCLHSGASGSQQNTAPSACQADSSFPQSSLSNPYNILFISLCFCIPVFVSCCKQQADKSVQLSPMGSHPCDAELRLPTSNKYFCNDLTTASISPLRQRKIALKKSSRNRSTSGNVCLDSVIHDCHRSLQRQSPRNPPQTSSR